MSLSNTNASSSESSASKSASSVEIEKTVEMEEGELDSTTDPLVIAGMETGDMGLSVLHSIVQSAGVNRN